MSLQTEKFRITFKYSTLEMPTKGSAYREGGVKIGKKNEKVEFLPTFSS